MGIVEKHLEQFGAHPPNEAMIERLKTAVQEGKKITGGDASFYMHELNEATQMARGIEYDIAHQAALNRYGVSPYSVYHIDVIKKYSSMFNKKFIELWEKLQ